MPPIFSGSRRPRRTAPDPPGDDRTRARYLRSLVPRIAMGDTGALAALYDTTFIRLRDGIVADGATADTVSAVIAATFVEVWHVSPHRVEVRADVEAWLAAIASQRMAERRFTSSSPSGGGGPPGAEPSWSALATKDHDQLMKMTLLDILHGSP